MSKFTTTIPTEIQSLIESLPKSSTIHGITLNPETKELVILWEHQPWESGLTVPVDFPITDLKRKTLPQGVIRAGKRQTTTTPPQGQENAPKPIVEPLKLSVAPQYMTSEQLEEAVKSGKSVEFQGIDPIWQPFNPKTNVFIDGYFYRLVSSLDKETVTI